MRSHHTAASLVRTVEPDKRLLIPPLATCNKLATQTTQQGRLVVSCRHLCFFGVKMKSSPSDLQQQFCIPTASGTANTEREIYAEFLLGCVVRAKKKFFQVVSSPRIIAHANFFICNADGLLQSRGASPCYPDARAPNIPQSSSNEEPKPATQSPQVVVVVSHIN